MLRRLFAVLVCSCAGTQLPAATPAADGTPDQLVARAQAVTPVALRELVTGEQVVPHWSDEGSRFWYAADRTGGVEYLQVDAESGTIRPLFDRAKLDHAIRETTGSGGSAAGLALDAVDYDFDTRELTFDLQGRRWNFDTLTGRLAPAAPVEGVLSPDKRWRVLMREHDLYLEDTATRRVSRLTTDGSAERPYARPIASLKAMTAQGSDSPVLPVDIVWSPDARRFVTYQMDLRVARRLCAVQSTPPDGGPPRTYEYVYPMAGDEKVPVAQTIIFTVATGAARRVETIRQEMLYFGAPQYVWTRDSSAVLQAIATRGYKSLGLYSIDAASGHASLLAQEESKRFVDYFAHRWEYLPAADAVLWMSELDGWNHTVLVDRNGRRTKLTSGRWTVSELAGGSESGTAQFLVGRGREPNRDPYLRHLYRVERDAGGVRLLTPEPVDHDVYVSPGGHYFVDNMSTIDLPTTSVLRSAVDGRILLTLQTADLREFKALGLRLPEPFMALAADGTTPLYGALYKPSTFDPGKRYPVVEYIYTGPHTITTPKSFVAGLRLDVAYSMTELGFVVVVLDGRGTSGRGRAFLDPAYRHLHGVGLDDHVTVIRELGRRHPWMDTSAVGVYGFSAGGYDVLRAMTERPGFYKAGISASGNHDNRLDKAVWNEQWMGFPLDDGYVENSNVTWAPKLEGDLLLTHGELDENVPMAATLRLADALLRANKRFELLIVPNADHWLGDLPHYNRRRFQFMLRALSPPRS